MRRQTRMACMAMILALVALAGGEAWAGTEMYQAGGTYQWTCPDGVNSVTVECWGGGGAGGGVPASANSRGGGGGGGAYSKKTSVSVTAGNIYTVVVGTNGTGASAASGTDGGYSEFNGDSTTRAYGGKGGSVAPAGGNGNGGLGGAANGTATASYAGGGGTNGTSSGGGGGGSGAGYGGAGSNGLLNVGGLARPNGEIGGNGAAGSVNAVGTANNLPFGGGGGGAGNSTGTGTRSGGAGASGCVIITWGTDTANSYRTSASGDWNDSTKWEYWDGGAWQSASVAPGAANSVFIQAGHTITLTQNESCRDLNIESATRGYVALGANKLSVYGFYRLYSASVGTIPGTDYGATARTDWPFTATSGSVVFRGRSRYLSLSGTGKNYYGIAPTAPQTGVFPVEVELNSSSDIATLDNAGIGGGYFSASSFDLKVGTLAFLMGTASSGILVNNNTANSGDITIRSGATMIFPTVQNGTIFGRTATLPGGTLTLESGGLIQITDGRTGVKIEMTTINLNGTVEYTHTANAITLATKAGTGAAPTTYTDLKLTGSTLAKNLSGNTIINGKFTRDGGSAAGGLALNGFTLTYGGNSTLEYAGVSQTTSTTDLPSSGPKNLKINSSGTVTLAGNATITGTVTMASGSLAQGAGPYTITYSGSASTLEYAGSALQTAATNEFPSSSGPVNLTITNAAGVSMGALSRTISGTLTLASGALANAGQLTLGNGASIIRDQGSVSVAPTLGTSVNVTYSGATAVTTGNEIPSSSTVLNNLTVNKSGGVTMGGNATVNGTLTLTSGALAIGANALTHNGEISVTSGTLTGGGSSDMIFGGAGAATTLPTVSGGLRHLTINRANGVNLGGDLTLGGTLTLTSGSFGVGANTLTLNGPAISGTAANLVTTSSSSLSLGGSSSSVAIPGSVSALNNLTINNANGVTLSGSPTVNGTLTLTSGKITTGGNTLTVASAGSINGASSSSYVEGKLARGFSATGSKTFPIGKSSNYRPLTLNYTALTGSSTVTAEQTESAFPGEAAGVMEFADRYWTLTESGSSARTYDITLDGTGFSPGAPVKILKYDNPDTVSYATTFSSPNYTATGLTSFSDFGLGELAGVPFITVTGGPFSFGNVEQNSASAEKTNTVSGANLTADITVTPPAGFEVSTSSGSGFSASPITLTQSGGTVAETPVYVRFKPGSVQSYDGSTLAYTSTGATEQDVTLNGTGIYGSSSDIAADGGFGTPANIAYGSYQETDLTDASLAVAQYLLRDGGAGGDTDSAGTTLTALTLTVGNSSALRRIALYDGSTELGEVAAGATATFSSLSVAAGDNSSKTLTVRASFQSTVTDNLQVSFTVSSATASGSGSGFAAGNAGGAASSTAGDNNRIEVSATKLVFGSVPLSVIANSNFTVEVSAKDANNNVDLDSTASVTLSKSSGSGNLSSATGLTQALVSGAKAWGDVQIDASGSFVIQAADGVLDPAVSDSISATVPVFAPAITNIGPLATTVLEDAASTNLQAVFHLLATNITEAGTLTWSVGTAATQGTVTVIDSGSTLSAEPDTFTYQPTANRNGGDTFVLTVSNSVGGLTSNITVSVDITAVNDAPTNTALPQVIGTLVVGQEVTATSGTWNDNVDTNASYPTPTITYVYDKWERADDANGANLTTLATLTDKYTLTSSEAMKYVRVLVTATDDGTPGTASATATSAWTYVERQAMAFTNVSGGRFNASSTWTPNTDYPRLPGDTATIGGSYTVTTLSNHEVTNQVTVNIQSTGKLQLAGPGASALSPIHSGAIVNVASNGTLEIQSTNNVRGTINLNGGTLSHNVANGGMGNLAAGATLNINSNSFLSPIGTAVTRINCPVHGTGKLTLTADTYTGADGIQFDAASTWSGAWDFQGNARFYSFAQRYIPGDERVATGKKVEFVSTTARTIKGTRSGFGTDTFAGVGTQTLGDGSGNGVLSPGDGAGGVGAVTMSAYGADVSHTFIFNAGSTYTVDITGTVGSAYDKLTVAGNGTGTGNVQVVSGAKLVINLWKPTTDTVLDATIVDGSGTKIGGDDFTGNITWNNTAGWSGLAATWTGPDLHVTGAYTVPVVTLTATDNAATEVPAETGTFTVARGARTDGDLVVNYRISGTATPGGDPNDYTLGFSGSGSVDYAAKTGTVTIADGAASATITVTPFDDALIENVPETVILSLTNGVYTIGSPSNDTVTITSDDAGNLTPEVSAGQNQTNVVSALPAVNVALSGSATDDGVEGPMSYLWSKVSGPGSVTFGGGDTVTNTTADFSAAGDYVLQLVADDGGMSGTGTVSVTIIVNAAPVVDAGPDQSVLLAAGAVALSGILTSDDGLPVEPTYTWSKDSGPGTVTFDDATLLDATASFSEAGTYVLRLTADDTLATGSDAVTITLRAPVTFTAQASGRFNAAGTWDAPGGVAGPPQEGDTATIGGSYTVTTLSGDEVANLVTVNIQSTGKLQLVDPGAVAISPIHSGATVNVAAGGTLEIQAENDVVGTINLNGGTLSHNGTTGNLAAGATLNINSDSFLTPTPAGTGLPKILCPVHGTGKLTLTANANTVAAGILFAAGSDWSGAWDFQGNIRFFTFQQRHIPGDERVALGKKVEFVGTTARTIKGTRSGYGTDTFASAGTQTLGDGSGNGVLSPGDGAGGVGAITMSGYGADVSHAFVFNSNSTYSVDIAGTASSSYDYVTVTGTGAGTGNVQVVDGAKLVVNLWKPSANTILDATIIDGTGAKIGAGDFTGNITWNNTDFWNNLAVSWIGPDLHVTGIFCESGATFRFR